MYIDLILSLNIVVNFFLLWLTGLITHQRTTLLRLFAGSVAGAAYLLVLFIPIRLLFFIVSGKIILPLLMILFSFRPRKPIQAVILFIAFYLCSFAMGGLVFAFSLWAKFPLDFYRGVYNLPAPSIKYLFFSGALLFLLVRWLQPILLEKLNFYLPTTALELEIDFCGKNKKLAAFLDTGNMLKEPFSGLPVAVAAYPTVKELLPQEICHVLSNGHMDWTQLEKALTSVSAASVSRYCLVPYRSLHDEGFLLGFRPERAALCQGSRVYKLKDGIIIGIQREKDDFPTEHEVLLPLEAWRSADVRGLV
ncbi:MAG: sigma-E processing peptidase SpoIIGA [Dethiobacteria bacterium]|jgi:stage II sporulation protein GA (sporulation sigma-E factor processing peptidase)